MNSLQVKPLRSRHRPTLVGPFLGELGFELLYWIPFVFQFVSNSFEDVTIVHRANHDLYRRLFPEAKLVDILDLVDIADYSIWQNVRVKERRFNHKSSHDPEYDLILRIVEESENSKVNLVPYDMFRMRQNVTDETYSRLVSGLPKHKKNGTSLKFWTGGVFPRSHSNSIFCKRFIESLANKGLNLKLMSNPYSLDMLINDDLKRDDDFWQYIIVDFPELIVQTSSYRTQLNEQFETLCSSQSFIGTYGGFSYLNLFSRTNMSLLYGARADIVFSRHFTTLTRILSALNPKNGNGPVLFYLNSTENISDWM